MAPKYHPTPLSGGDRKALAKELGKARTIANILAPQSVEMRAKGEALIQQADRHRAREGLRRAVRACRHGGRLRRSAGQVARQARRADIDRGDGEELNPVQVRLSGFPQQYPKAV